MNNSRKRTKEITHSCVRKATGQHGKRRCGESSKRRRINDVTPNRQQNIGQDEEDLIVKLHALLGNRWSMIAGRLPGRTENEVKEYWDSTLKRKLVCTGIDPNNHHVDQAICRPSRSSSCSCSLNINHQDDDDDETRSSPHKAEADVVSHDP